MGRGHVSGKSVVLALPQTFMNASGEAVRALCEKNGIGPEDLCIVFDDIDRGTTGQLLTAAAGINASARRES